MKCSAQQVIRKIKLESPPCTLGITDGSERGDYAGSAHMLRRIGRPHQVVNLMFQYYPDMEHWPTQGVKWHGFYRNNSLNEGDGYFPLVLEEGGAWGRAYLKQIADVRAHGQDPQLTLTLHCDTPNEILERIAKSLVPYGRMRLRINHECNGNWFYFNRRWSFKEVSDFFIRFHHILHEHAPEVLTVACWNGPGEAYEAPEKLEKHGKVTPDQLGPMFQIADVISFDQYASLHYLWPDPTFDPQRPSGFFSIPFEYWWKTLVDCHELMSALRGSDVNIEVHEVNQDAELFGVLGQADWIERFYREAVARKYPWLTNITFYMFRDRGGLGLEWENTDDPEKVEDRPALAAYQRAIQNAHFEYRVTEVAEPVSEPLAMKWVSSVESEGVEISCHAPQGGEARILLPREQHVLAGCGGYWVIKRSGEESVALPLVQGENKLQFFMPPPDGRNNVQGAYETMLSEIPVVELT
ncbi:MAG: hypothetical protein PHG65_11330 [Kiritimatiellae bacterium]|nr:hypothetical protein [Kiritimatiellia bacterium]